MSLLKACTMLGRRSLRRSTFTLARRFTHAQPLRYLVGVDGTNFGYSAMKRAFECSQDGDKIIGLYFPPSLERFETELMMFGPSIGDPEAKKLWGELEKSQKEHVATVKKECEDVNDLKNPDAKVEFLFEVGEPSPSPKHDLVHACYDYEVDCLVVGSKGLAHGLKAHLKKGIAEHVIGSVPDYCADHAPCDVLIVKPKEY